MKKLYELIRLGVIGVIVYSVLIFPGCGYIDTRQDKENWEKCKQELSSGWKKEMDKLGHLFGKDKNKSLEYRTE